MKQILINPVQRAGSTCVKEIEVGNKFIKSVQTLPKLQTKKDIEVIFAEDKNQIDFDGVVLDLWSSSDMGKSLFVGKGQRRLDDNAIALTPTKMKMDEKVIIIDPNTEEYHFPYFLKTDKVTDTKLSRLDKVFGLKSYPAKFKDVFTDYKGNGGWLTANERNLLLSYVDWHVRYCVDFGADIILPPTPLIDSKASNNMLEIVKNVNELTTTIIRERTEVCPSIYFPISCDVFKGDASKPGKILDLIIDLARPHSMVALKFFRSGRLLDSSIVRRRIREFLMMLDSVKKDNHDNLAIMILDTKAEGVAYFGNGVDLTCDPLGGVKDSPFGRPKRGEDTGDGEESQNELQGYGKWFDRNSREYQSIQEMKSDPDSILNGIPEGPYRNCVEAALTKEKDMLGFPNRDTWNTTRRLNNFLCRRNEDELINQEVMAGNDKAVELFLNERRRGNHNLVDLIP